jgi:hypothetical protein
VAWFLDSPRTHTTVGHATHPPADAGLLRLCFPERRQNLYTSRAIPVLSCPHPASPVIICLRTGHNAGQGRAAASTLEQRRNNTDTISILALKANKTIKMPPLDNLETLVAEPLRIYPPDRFLNGPYTCPSADTFRYTRPRSLYTSCSTRGQSFHRRMPLELLFWLLQLQCGTDFRTRIAASFTFIPPWYVWRLYRAAGKDSVSQPQKS